MTRTAAGICLTATLAALAALPAAAQRPIPLDTVHAAGSRVLAGAVEATRSIEVIGRAEIARVPARSVNDIIARALGVDLMARSAAQADLGIRGSSFEQILVMVDGVPVNDDQTGHFHLNVAVPLEAVERIEILRGPASALYGSGAVGGVVNIVTGGAAHRLAASARGGSFSTLGASADMRQRAGRMDFYAAGDYDRSDGHRPGTDHEIVQARAGMTATVAGGRMAAHAGWAARDFGAEGFYAPFDSWEATRATTASIAWRDETRALAIEPRVAFRRHDDDFVLVRGDPGRFRNIHSSEQTAAELVVRWTGAGVRLAAGGEAALSRLESTNLGDRRETRLAGFAEVVAGDVASAMATAGLRLDRHSTFGTYLSPSVAAGLRLSGVRLRASAGAGFRAPSFTDRFYRDPANIGNPDLDAEKFRTAELGIGAAPAGGAIRLDAALFVRQARDMIDWARPAGSAPSEPWRTMNVERARFAGLETSLAGDIGAAAVTVRAALLAVSARTAGGLESKYALRPLTRTAALEAGLPVAAGVRVQARAAVYRRMGGAAWHLVDLRLTRAAGPFHLFLDATNLTGTMYRDIAGRPAPGRALGAGIRVVRH
jgi:iron complex outermembrane receptor protein